MREDVDSRVNLLAAPVREFDGLKNFLTCEVVTVSTQAEIFPAEINSVRPVNQRGLKFLEISCGRAKSSGLTILIDKI